MALRRPGGIDLNPDRGPMRHAPGTPAGATAKVNLKPQPETTDLPSSSDSSSPSLGPDHLKLKQQRYAGQPADRQRSGGPAVAAAAVAFQGTSAPTPKEPAPRRGPAPGRARRTGWVPVLEGRTRDASTTQ
eukprot:6028681-Pyramimonas_sp.AAC.1